MRVVEQYGPAGFEYVLVATTHQDHYEDLGMQRVDASAHHEVLDAIDTATLVALVAEVAGTRFEVGDEAVRQWVRDELGRPRVARLVLLREPGEHPPIAPGQFEAADLSDLAPPEEQTTFIAFQLLGADNEPLSDIQYDIHLSDGTTATGATDGDGKGRHDGIPRGGCTVSFPSLQQNLADQANS